VRIDESKRPDRDAGEQLNPDKAKGTEIQNSLSREMLSRRGPAAVIAESVMVLSAAGLVWSVVVFLSFSPYFFLSDPRDYYYQSPRALYLYVAPESLILFPTFLALVLRHFGKLTPWRGIFISVPIVILGSFMLPTIPVSTFLQHCGSYFTSYESVGYYLLGKGLVYTPILCF
jgi:hypothetical protein